MIDEFAMAGGSPVMPGTSSIPGRRGGVLRTKRFVLLLRGQLARQGRKYDLTNERLHQVS